MRLFRPKRFRHFPDVSGAPERRERVIATARVLLAGAAILYAALGPIQPLQNSGPIADLLAGYLVLSLVLWLALRYKPTADFPVCLGAHAADLMCTTALTVLSRGPASPFFLFFVFVLLAAAYRWGFAGTVFTAGAGVALLAAEDYALTPTSMPAHLVRHLGVPMAQPFAFNLLLLQCAYLLMVGLLLGYLAEGEKALQSEAAATAQIIGKAQVGGGLKATLEGMVEELLAAFRADRAMFTAEELRSGRMFVWEARLARAESPVALTVREVERKEMANYRCTQDTGGWFAWRAMAGNYHMVALSPKAPNRPPLPWAMPAALPGSRAVLAIPFRLANEWEGWVCLFNTGNRLGCKKQLRLLRRIVDAAAPAAYNAYLLSRMRWQIGEQERARLARELHDGAIQSLVSAELQMHALRRRADPGANTGQLDHVENMIHDQVLNLRQIMEQIRPIDPDPRRLVEFLADQVEKFQRETGIEATFAADGSTPRLTGRSCGEMIRIAQELLFNVRRHSGAKRVDVRLRAMDGTCRLEVADDGRGFDFTGRFDQAALEAARKGPRVVQERLRALGGSLAIESYPGKGARLEIDVPQREE